MNELQKAVELLNNGELVAFPTETVYGLGADAANTKAVEKIFEAKKRPVDHPVIIHVYDLEQLSDWVNTDFLSEQYKIFAQQFWPGPLTLIFNAKSSVPKMITGGQDTIGIRMPSHPIARELLKQFGKPIAAPSANRFGKISPTKASHVKEELGESVKLILDGGDCPCGIESTIIDITKDIPVILRPGPLDIETLKKMTGIQVIYSYFNKKSDINHPRVSGSLPSHYAPNTFVELIELKDFDPTAFGKNNLDGIAVMSFQVKPNNFSRDATWVTMPENPVYYAKVLYATLRELDKQHFTTIYIESPPDLPLWQAIRDRLMRAAAKNER